MPEVRAPSLNLRQDNRESIGSALLVVVVVVPIVGPQREPVLAPLLDALREIFSHLQLPGRRGLRRLFERVDGFVGTFTLVSSSGGRQRFGKFIYRLRRGADLRAVA